MPPKSQKDQRHLLWVIMAVRATWYQSFCLWSCLETLQMSPIRRVILRFNKLTTSEAQSLLRTPNFFNTPIHNKASLRPGVQKLKSHYNSLWWVNVTTTNTQIVFKWWHIWNNINLKISWHKDRPKGFKVIVPHLMVTRRTGRITWRPA